MVAQLEPIADTLKAARKRLGLSQRALAAKAGVPQSHISKIENAAVDLQTTSLIAIARALDLELELVPREIVGAVQSLAGEREGPYLFSELLIDRHLKRSASRERRLAALRGFNNALRSLRGKPIDIASLRRLLDRADFQLSMKNPDGRTLINLTKELRTMRDDSVHARQQDAQAQRPAYSLDEDDDA